MIHIVRRNWDKVKPHIQIVKTVSTKEDALRHLRAEACIYAKADPRIYTLRLQNIDDRTSELAYGYDYHGWQVWSYHLEEHK